MFRFICISAIAGASLYVLGVPLYATASALVIGIFVMLSASKNDGVYSYSNDEDYSPTKSIQYNPANGNLMTSDFGFDIAGNAYGCNDH